MSLYTVKIRRGYTVDNTIYTVDVHVNHINVQQVDDVHVNHINIQQVDDTHVNHIN